MADSRPKNKKDYRAKGLENMVSPTAKDTGVKGSHSVWRHYLKQFSSDGKSINACDVHTDKKFKISVNSATVCNDIYTLEEEISPADVFFIKAAASLGYPLSEQDNTIIDEIVGFLNNDLRPFMNIPDDFALEMRKKIIQLVGQKALKRNQEELFSYYEENFLPLYKMLLNKDSNFYNLIINDDKALKGYCAALAWKTSNFLHLKSFDLMQRLIAESGTIPDEVFQARDRMKMNLKKTTEQLGKKFEFSSEKYFSIYYFVIFILTQFFRTQRNYGNFNLLEENAEKNFPQYKGIFNYKNFMTMIVHWQAYRVGINLVDEKYRIVFLINDSDLSFITSDQPVINTYGALFPEKKQLDHNEFELYYPLCPKLAILYTDRDCYKEVNEINLRMDSIMAYNNLIKQSCFKNIYSDTPFT